MLWYSFQQKEKQKNKKKKILCVLFQITKRGYDGDTHLLYMRELFFDLEELFYCTSGQWNRFYLDSKREKNKEIPQSLP